MQLLPIKDFKYVWSDFGLFPVSLYIELEETDVPLDCFESVRHLYKLITDKKHTDIIFKLTNTEYYEPLSFLLGRLLLENYHVTIITRLTQLQGLVSNSFTILTYLDELKRNIGILKQLSLESNIIIQEDNINKLKLCLNLLNNNDIKLKVFFDTALLSKEEVLENKVYECFPTTTNFEE